VDTVSRNGEAVQRRQIELQLRLIRALYDAESKRGDSMARAFFIARAEPILDSTEAAMTEGALGTDDELRDLLQSVRREIGALRD
jgi:hypothetical protein